MPTTPAAPVMEIGYAAKSKLLGWMELADEEPTPELRWPRSIEVYDAMRSQDSQVGSVLRAVTYPVRRTPWRVDAAGARDEVVEFTADNLGLPIVGSEPKPLPRTRDRFSWPEHLRLALLMLPFGHMYFEQVYRITDDGKRARLRKLGERMPRTIEKFDIADDGGLVSITQFSAKVGQLQRAIPVDRLVAYVLEREGGNWVGRSVLRGCYKNWLLKDRLLRVDAQTIERNGMGIPLYKGAPGETDLTKGAQMAQQWRAGESAGAAVPDGADMLLRGVEGDLPQALPSIRYHDEQIGRSVLAHFLNLGTQTGSWALGSTFADFFTMSLQTLAQQIADVATQHIVEDLVDVNFGEDEPAPRIVFDEIGSRQEATAAALKMLVDAGILRPDRSLEEDTRQQYGLPAKDNPAPPANDRSSR
ncbi:phage portal protein family protein [Micromonospora chersina]|uniref:phage portal protein family protein n=1 Tax=Micromonospora chersina TaxID=47854 RepID=UPI0033C86C40